MVDLGVLCLCNFKNGMHAYLYETFAESTVKFDSRYQFTVLVYNGPKSQ